MRTLAFVASLTAASCASPTAPVNCTQEFRVGFSPSRQIQLATGETATLEVGMSTCQGQVQLTDRITWTSENPGIVAVGSISGVVKAIAVGQAEIQAKGRKYGNIATFTVTVQ